MEVAPGVLGWLGLTCATRHRAPGEVEIMPVVGVRFQEVERVVAECRRDKVHAYTPATTLRPLGELMPGNGYRAWLLSPGGAEAPAERMVREIEQYGLPYIRSLVDLEALRERLTNKSASEHERIYRRPVAALLAGDLADARACVAQNEAAIVGRIDLAANDIRQFDTSLLERMSRAPAM